MRGRKFKGLRGWAGKPLHPPLTDIPVAAYLLVAVFDVISYVGGDDKAWSHDFYRAASFTLIGGAAVSVLAALTGFADWITSTSKGTQARRTANAHALAMVLVTLMVLGDIAWRVFGSWDETVTPGGITALSVVIALVVSAGAAIGGTLVYDYGFNVETAGDSPVWHESETDVLPGQKPAPVTTAESEPVTA
jgi:uncharacterized membrane protein